MVRDGIVTISKHASEEGGITSFRGQAIVPFDPPTVAALIADPTQQTAVNPQLKSCSVVSESPGAVVWHKVFRAKKCMLDIHRDLLFCERRVRVGRLLVFCASSSGVDQSLVGSPEKCVRGHVHLAGWVLEEWEAAGGKIHTSLTYLAQVDLKNLPAAVVEIANKEQPLVVQRISEALEKGVRGAPYQFPKK